MSGTPRAALRDAIFRSGRPQVEIARLAGIHETRLSKIVRGWVDPNAGEMSTLARVLKGHREELFPEEEGARHGA
jgi:DNA-binding transcriptional regulator YdaS (Cro superfamily)